MEIFNVEVTDTYGGEANYSWVRRYTIRLPDQATRLQIVRAAKKEAEWNGMRCRTDSYGDSWTLHPTNGDCVVMFINFDDVATSLQTDGNGISPA